MAEAKAGSDPARDASGFGPGFGDPRRGDVEDDASSTKQRSLLAIAGSLLAEISLAKLLFAWAISIVLPGLLLGFAPLAATAWLSTLSNKVASLTGVGTAFVLLVVAAVGWVGWRPLLRLAETNFWSLNALAVQPGYAFCREAIRHIAEALRGKRLGEIKRARLRALSAAGAGIILCAVAVLIAFLAWPHTRWVATMTELLALQRLIVPTLANAVVIVTVYLAGASLVWGAADSTMKQPLDLAAFDTLPEQARSWRVAHLSDVHVVGERYGFRIESGRAGPRGNDRFQLAMARLAAIHAADPLDVVLVSGDMTDAGSSAEWGEFFDIAAGHPELARRMFILPGNHDVNIVDRANPARLDLPFSPAKRLRQMRSLGAIASVQGDRVLVVEGGKGETKHTLNQALAPHRHKIETFLDQGGVRLSIGLGHLWDEFFPMIVPPDADDGLGMLILNSNAETHFSFTNALGLIPLDQEKRLQAVIERYPRANWIVALHHHLVEYPTAVAAFSERIGTALINGSWFVRTLWPIARRSVVMHGHRHIDWIGACGDLKIVSAPSPVMGLRDEPTHFYIHTLAASPDGRLLLAQPERIDLSADG